VLGSGQLGQWVGLRFGEYLGRQIALGACRDDNDDEIERREFRSPIATASLPKAVDLRSWMTPVEDQGSIGSCTSNALAGALEYLIHREKEAHVDLSRLFVYFGQRLWDDRVREDSGASIASGIRVLSRVGIPREASWPYQKDLFAVQPPEAVFREAATHRVLDWWHVPIDADALRGCLAAGFPVVFGTRVTESFVKTPQTGMCGMPSGADDKKHGRHALLLVGYDDARRVFVTRNSWGADWGERGYVYMPYEYVLNKQWTSSGWAIRLTTRETYDPSQPVPVNLMNAPKAPPEGSGIGTSVVGTAANVGAQVAVGAITGSRLLAGLAGGLLAGVTPGVAKLIRGRDRGAYLDRDRSEEILAVLKGNGAAPAQLAPMPWDDGLDEEAAARAGIPIQHSPKPAPVSPVAAIPVPFAPPPVPAAPIPRASPDFVSRMPNRIAAVWRESKASLGAPVAEPARMQESSWNGSVVRFEKGAIFVWDPLPDAPVTPPFALADDDATFAEWQRLGAGRSALGWPSGPVQKSPDGTLRILWCTRGALFEHPTRGVHALFGMLYAYWQSLGGFASNLGAPVGQLEVPNDPREPQTIQLERGKLVWSPSAGARVES
jgi:hypothetical protein